MNSPLSAKGLLVVMLPVAALMLSVVLISQLEKQKEDAVEWVKHAQDLKEQILSTYIVAISAESAVRNYALTGHEEGLQPYERAGVQLDVVLDRIRDLVKDNAEQTKSLPRLKELIHQRLDELKALRGYYDSEQTRGKEAPQQLLRQAEATSNQALLALTQLYTTEDRVLKERTKQNKDRQTIFYIAIVASIVLGLLGAIVAVGLFTRGIARRVKQAESSANRLEQGLPLLPVAPGNDELGRLASALERTGTILAKQGEELKLALDSAQVLIFELEPSSGRIRYHAGSEPLKAARFPSELLPETITGWLAVVHTDDRNYVRQELDRVLANGGSFQIDYRVVLGGGEIRWMTVKARLHAEENGRPRRLAGVKIDITERRKASEEIARQAQELADSREALHQQTRILRSILDSMGDGVVVADQLGQFLVFNPAAQEILGSSEFIGEPQEWAKRYGLFQSDMVSLYTAEQLPFTRAIRGDSVDGEEIFVRPAGAVEGAWLSITARPLREEDGGIHGGVMVMRDVTAAKRAAEALEFARQEAERANQAKSEFLSRMSHELRTPLNSVLGFAQLLELQDLAPQQSDNVQRIIKGGNHLLGLINEVLDLSRIEAGRFSLSPEPVRMREALRDALDLVRPLALQQKINISSDIAIRCDRHVRADRQRLKQVLLNLLSNAIKFNRKGGSVMLECELTPSNTLRLEIADTGPGIPAEGIQKLFKPFERLGADLTGVEGTGLGLALTKRLVEAMGGHIGVESVVGLGSRFFVELELTDHPADAVEQQLVEVLEQSENGESRQGTVLYIEDNLSNLQLMEQILEHRPGVRLLSAMQGHLGLDLARLHSPDLILLDVHLPDMNGSEVLRRLREDHRTRHIPVTVVSADATASQISRLLAAGANEYMTKPLDVKNLLRLLEQTLPHSDSEHGVETPSYAERNRKE